MDGATFDANNSRLYEQTNHFKCLKKGVQLSEAIFGEFKGLGEIYGTSIEEFLSGQVIVHNGIERAFLLGG